MEIIVRKTQFDYEVEQFIKWYIDAIKDSFKKRKLMFHLCHWCHLPIPSDFVYCRICKRNQPNVWQFHFHTAYVPPWKRYEEAMTHPDSKQQGKATDLFNAVRDHEIKTDPQAKRWEESRKERLNKDKPYWVKQQMEKERQQNPFL